MNGIMSLLGIKDDELKNAIEGFSDLFVRIERIEKKLDRILRLIEEDLGDERDDNKD